MRKSRFHDPSGELHVYTRSRTQRDPKYAVITSQDGKKWGRHTITESKSNLLENILESLKYNKFTCVVVPKTVRVD